MDPILAMVCFQLYKVLVDVRKLLTYINADSSHVFIVEDAAAKTRKKALMKRKRSQATSTTSDLTMEESRSTSVSRVLKKRKTGGNDDQSGPFDATDDEDDRDDIDVDEKHTILPGAEPIRDHARPIAMDVLGSRLNQGQAYTAAGPMQEHGMNGSKAPMNFGYMENPPVARRHPPPWEVPNIPIYWHNDTLPLAPHQPGFDSSPEYSANLTHDFQPHLDPSQLDVMNLAFGHHDRPQPPQHLYREPVDYSTLPFYQNQPYYPTFFPFTIT